MAKAQVKEKGKVGRPRKISKEQALKIRRMVERMPDAEIPVDWDNVIAMAKSQFRETYTRGMLSQDKWDDRRLIHEAFTEAQKVQKRLQKDSAPKYGTASRDVLLKRITKQDAKILALQEELEEERAKKVDTLDTFLNTRCDLRKLLLKQKKQLLQEGTDEF